MRVIPVIDLKHGQVVHAVAGRRQDYRPIVSLLCDDPSPASVGAAFRRLGFSEAYVADLDAIAGGEPNNGAYEQLCSCGLRLYLDAGLATAERALILNDLFHDERRLSGLIIGLESLASLPDLVAIVAAITPSRLIFSLDLRRGVPVCRVPPWQTFSAERITQEVVELGIRRLIVLDIAQVGTGEGVGTLALCRRLRERHADIEIISGGGVRDREDLERLAAAGCDAALVASALHDGCLTETDLRPFF
ncbi:MAG TPA: HisA/HisF-related TIM barrel protein [Pirellulales bacterium]